MSEYVITLLAAAAVTYILTPVVRRFAVAVGAMHAARERDVHEMPTPLLGGFAIYGGLAAALLLASRLSGLHSVFTETNMAKGLLLAGGLVVIMGFVDDRWGMGALSKLAGQVAAGVILVWSGAEIPWLPAPGGVTLILTSDQQVAVTILVVVVTMNAVNFIDGLDGLAAGIVGIGAIAFFAYYFTLVHRLGLLDQTEPALVSALLAGVCIGFLPHNFYPARIFMGDTGSMLIGLMLAYAPISSLALLDPASLTDPAAYQAGTVNRYGAFIPLLVPAAILLIPYADLLMAVVRRTRAGKSVFAPDKKHLQHRLLAIGHSHRSSVLIMYLWAALFSGTVIWLSIVRTPLFVLAIVTVAAVLGLLLVTMPRLRPWSRASVAADGVTADGVAADGAVPDGAAGGLGQQPGTAAPAVVRPAGATAGTALADGTAPGGAGLANAGAARGTPAGPAQTRAAPGQQAGQQGGAGARRPAAAPVPERPGRSPAATAGSLANAGWRPGAPSLPGNGATDGGGAGHDGASHGGASDDGASHDGAGHGAVRDGSGTAGAEAPDGTDSRPVTHAAGPGGRSGAVADAVPLRGNGRAVPPWEDEAAAMLPERVAPAQPARRGARRSARAGRAVPPWETGRSAYGETGRPAVPPWEATRVVPPWMAGHAVPPRGDGRPIPPQAAAGRAVPPWETTAGPADPEASGPVAASPWASPPGPAADAPGGSGNGHAAPPWPPASPPSQPWPPATPPRT
jgi:UDP-GlcNAc:undecaprenyl-phosphate/decaprenyl-phosphate GlcNAc-1-phosphate transferase